MSKLRAELIAGICADLQPKPDKNGIVAYSLRTGAQQREPVYYPTGILTLDVASGRGGLPTSRTLIFHGKPKSSKTTTMNAFMASIQRRNGIAILVDNERKHDLAWAAMAGVDISQLIWVKPRTIEAGFEMVQDMCEKIRKADDHIPIVIGWDSLQSGNARKTMAKSIDDGGGYSPESGAYSRAIRMITPVIDDTAATLILIDQVRADVGSPIPGQEKIGVGNAPGHASAIIIDFESKKLVDMKKKTSRTEVTGCFLKNNVADDGATFKYVIDDAGIDFDGSVFYAARDIGLLVMNGSWCEMDLPGVRGGVKFQGIEGWRPLVEEDPTLIHDVREATLEAMHAKFARSRKAAEERILAQRSADNALEIASAVSGAEDEPPPRRASKAKPEAETKPTRARRASK